MSEKPTYEELEQRVRELEQAESERKRAEEALRESEARLAESNQLLAGVLEYTHMLAAFLDPRFNFIWVNRAYADAGRHEPSFFPGKNHFDLYPHEENQAIFQRVVDTGEPFFVAAKPFEYPDQPERGLTYWDWSLIPVKDDSGKVTGLVFTLAEVTERIRAEEALQTSEKRRRILFDNAIDGIVLADAENGIIIDCNNAFTELVGRDKSELIGKSQKIIHPPEDTDIEVSKSFQQHRTNKEGQILETQVITKTGEIKDVEIKASMLELEGKQFLLGIFRDVTERKRAEAALLENEHRLRMALEATSDGLWDRNLETGEVYRSPNVYSMLGYSTGDLEPNFEAWDKLLHPDDKPKVLKAMYDHFAGTTDEFRLEHRILSKSGDWQWILNRGKVVEWDENGNPSRFLGTIENISEYKRVEEQKNKLESQLQQAHKMESIGTLAGGIAHDFNNILSPIMIHTEMAMTDLSPDSHLHHHFKQIYVSSQRARDLVKQVLTFSRQRNHERIPLKLSLVVNENIKLIRSTFPSTIQICQDIKAESDTVLADPTQINQVLLNLCTNASHAMREAGGELTINLNDELLDSEDAGKFSDLNPGSYLRLTVSDTGHGIEPEVMNQIFEPYFTTKNVGEGTGMGLSVVHGIVKSYGGDVTVESEPGKGTTFHVLLPKIEADVSPIAEHKIVIPKGSERILLVDDEKVAIDVFQQMLENFGYKVTARTSSIEALEAFRHNPEAFDLVITDMTMPNMTGKELAKELMAIRSDIPIILCTGFSEQIDKDKAKAMGLSAFVMKPIVMREIANTIREVLDKK